MKKYDKYKESGIERIGKVPEQWGVKKLKYFAKISNGKDQKGVLVDEGGYPILGTGGEFGRASEFLYNMPSVLLGRKGTIDKPMFITEPFWTVDTLFYTQIKEGVSPKFFFYACTTIPFAFYQESSAVPSMTQENLNDITFCSPTLEEQTAIASFLDYKTAQIDALIEKKEQLIVKLKAQRQAIINEAVTKGLNPDAPMKDSGIEWLGEIPEHWEVTKLRYLIQELESGVSVNSTEESILDQSTIAVLKTSCISKLFFERNENKKVVEEDLKRVKCPVRKNSILISRMNTPNLVGSSGYIEKDYPNLFLPDRLWQTVMYPDYENSTRFISYLLISNTYKMLLATKASGTSPSMQNITKGALLDIEICIPKEDEQDQIIHHLSEEIEKIDKLENKLEQSIKKLKLYRQSIISEAVTGKIDVRDWDKTEK
jgi:type I restriction enzyme S subunit